MTKDDDRECLFVNQTHPSYPPFTRVDVASDKADAIRERQDRWNTNAFTLLEELRDEGWDLTLDEVRSVVGPT